MRLSPSGDHMKLVSEPHHDVSRKTQARERGAGGVQVTVPGRWYRWRAVQVPHHDAGCLWHRRAGVGSGQAVEVPGEVGHGDDVAAVGEGVENAAAVATGVEPAMRLGLAEHVEVV